MTKSSAIFFTSISLSSVLKREDQMMVSIHKEVGHPQVTHGDQYLNVIDWMSTQCYTGKKIEKQLIGVKQHECCPPITRGTGYRHETANHRVFSFHGLSSSRVL